MKLQEKIFREKGILLTLKELEKRLEEETKRNLAYIKEKLEENLYHWYDEPPNALITIKSSKLKLILEELKLKLNAKSIEDLLLNKLKIPRKQARKYLKILEKPTPKLKVKTLLQLCKHLKINPNQLELLDAFTRKFPVNLKSPTITKLLTHMINEGNISKRTKGKYPKATYDNKDPTLHVYIRKLLENLGVKYEKPPTYKKNAYTTNIDATTTRILVKAGLKPGKKTITNPTLPTPIYTNPQLRKYHIQTTLTEEGSSTVRISGKRVKMEITWDRSIDITDKLTPKQKQTLKQILEKEKEKRIPIGKVKKKIKDKKIANSIIAIAYGNSPKLVREETALLNKLHISDVKQKIVKSYPMRIQLSKDGRFTVAWRAYIANPKAIDLIVKKYGMLPNTWKEERLKKQYEIYLKYREKRLSDEEIKQVKKQIKSIPRRMPTQWRKQRFKELFEKDFK